MIKYFVLASFLMLGSAQAMIKKDPFVTQDNDSLHIVRDALICKEVAAIKSSEATRQIDEEKIAAILNYDNSTFQLLNEYNNFEKRSLWYSKKEANKALMTFLERTRKLQNAKLLKKITRDAQEESNYYTTVLEQWYDN